MKKKLSLILAFLFTFMSFNVAYGETEKEEPVEPRIKAVSAISVDLSNDEIILTKEPHKKMYPASITKLMTALILAETRKPQDMITIEENALAAEPFAINTNLYILYPGDTITVENALYAILMASANDMAVAAAVDVGGTVDNFVKMMNTKAKTLGMTETNFMNPTGLHDDNHYSTAYDISLLMKAAYANPIMRPIMGTKTHDIRTTDQPIGEIEHTADTITLDGHVAAKTGFTEEAGNCLASVYSREGRDLVLVVLKSSENFGSTQTFTDIKTLADESYAMKKTLLITKGDAVDPIEQTYKLFKWFGPEKKLSVKSVAAEDISFYNNTLNAESNSVKVVPLKGLDVFTLKKGAKVADLEVSIADKKENTYSTSESSAIDLLYIPNAVTYLSAAAGALIGLILLIFIIFKLFRMRASTQKKIMAKRQERRRKASRYNKDREL
ncbi:MAG: D-alanyl-D-alanine carboxypeptidase family protein [Clostridiaceae bacterium]